MVIRVLAFVPAADTGVQGAVIRDIIYDVLRSDTTVSISFSGIDSATSSFVNVCFVDLLHSFSFGDIKERVKVIDSTAQINEMIKSRLLQVASAEAA